MRQQTLAEEGFEKYRVSSEKRPEGQHGYHCRCHHYQCIEFD